MSEEVGIKETKELLKFVIKFGEAIDKAMVDKKFELSELGLLVGPLMLIGPAFEGIDKIAGELKDLSDAERLELTAFVKEELELENDKVEEIIETSFSVGLQLYGLIQLFSKKEEAQA